MAKMLKRTIFKFDLKDHNKPKQIRMKDVKTGDIIKFIEPTEKEDADIKENWIESDDWFLAISDSFPITSSFHKETN